MGALRRWWKSLFPAPLPTVASFEVRVLALPQLHMHTAENMAVLTLPVAAVNDVLQALDHLPVRLESPGAVPVTLLRAVDERQVPARDPAEGWLVPFNEVALASLRKQVGAQPGGWEIEGLNFGVVVE